MKKTIYKKTDSLSEDKSKTMQKLAEKMLKFCRENKIDKLHINFMSQDCTPDEKDRNYGNYVYLCMTDTKNNDLFNMCEWEERV